MKRPIKLLALDLDGTVLNNAKQITPATRNALAAAIAAGVTVIPASGRPLSGLCPEFLSIPGVNYALTSNGAAVYRLSDGALLHTDYLDTATAAEIMERLSPLNLMVSFFASGRGYAFSPQLPLLSRLSVSESVREYLRVSRVPLEDPVSFIRENRRIEKFTLNFLHDAEGSWVDYEAVRDVLRDYPSLSVVSGGTDNLEISAPTANKGHALLALAGRLGIPREQTMACGDSENDLAMLDAAGFSVAMANSEECVFPHADAVTSSNEEDGVAEAIRAYILPETAGEEAPAIFREMRRRRQELSREDCVEVLKTQLRGVLSVLGENGYPYGIPMDHWYDEAKGTLCFHGAKSGHKLDAIRACDKASFCVCDEGWRREDEWALNIRSVVVFGHLRIVNDPARVTEICTGLCRKFTDDAAYLERELQRSLPSVLCLELTPEHITGKLVNES